MTSDFCTASRLHKKACPTRSAILTVVFACSLTGNIASVLGQDDIALENAADRITLLVKEGAGRMTIPCRVLDFTGKAITFRTPAGTVEKQLDASLVVDVQTPQVAAHVEGVKRFQQGDWAEARKSLEIALEQEPRTWVRREILALLVRCSLRQGDYPTAGNRFLALTRSDPATRHYDIAPLCWTLHDAGPEWKAAALSWKVQTTESARLLWASVMLHDPKFSQEADLDLKRLATSTTEGVSRLADAQLWRKRLSDGDMTREEIERWHARTLAMPERLRGGAFYVIGTGYRLRNEPDRSAVCLLWLPLVYSEDVSLAARAGVEAGDQLRRVGQKREAVAIYEEVRRRFPGTSSAVEATGLLESLESNEKSATAPADAAQVDRP